MSRTTPADGLIDHLANVDGETLVAVVEQPGMQRVLVPDRRAFAALLDEQFGGELLRVAEWDDPSWWF